MNKTKIEWCDSTWNPVTGCLHECEYCYARRIATRFGGASHTTNNECGCECQWITEDDGGLHDLSVQVYDEDRCHNAPYPFGFSPTLHRYRLGEPVKWTKPRTIFVCSMADLFGDWVPDEWIAEVFAACKAAPQHRYLFLTKNPYRYQQLLMTGKLIGGEHIWLGTTLTAHGKLPFEALTSHQNFVSLEPLLAPVVGGKFPFTNIQWVIIGAETGTRKDKVVPELSWIEDIVAECDAAGIILYLNTGTAQSPVWSAIGKRVEDSSMEFDWGEETKKDIFGDTYTTMKKPIITQTFDPCELDAGDAAQVKLWNQSIKDQDTAAMCNNDLLVVHTYAGTASTAVFAERYPSSMVKPSGLGGSANVGMPIDVTLGGTRTTGTAAVSDAGVVTFTADT